MFALFSEDNTAFAHPVCFEVQDHTGAEMLLHNPENSISEIATACGFESPSNFSKIFKRFYKCTPREYRKKKMISKQKCGLLKLKMHFGKLR